MELDPTAVLVCFAIYYSPHETLLSESLPVSRCLGPWAWSYVHKYIYSGTGEMGVCFAGTPTIPGAALQTSAYRTLRGVQRPGPCELWDPLHRVIVFLCRLYTRS